MNALFAAVRRRYRKLLSDISLDSPAVFKTAAHGKSIAAGWRFVSFDQTEVEKLPGKTHYWHCKPGMVADTDSHVRARPTAARRSAQVPFSSADGGNSFTCFQERPSNGSSKEAPDGTGAIRFICPRRRPWHIQHRQQTARFSRRSFPAKAKGHGPVCAVNRRIEESGGKNHARMRLSTARLFRLDALRDCRDRRRPLRFWRGKERRKIEQFAAVLYVHGRRPRADKANRPVPSGASFARPIARPFLKHVRIFRHRG